MSYETPACETPTERILSHLRSLPETTIHTEFVEPILRRIASHVRYVHGPNERGKDFVYLTQDIYGDGVLEVCQVKNAPFTGKAGLDTHTLAILTQLQQCRNSTVLNPESSVKEKPQVVSLWTTYPLPDKDTADGAEFLDQLKELRCKVVTPEKFVQLIQQHTPDTYDRFAFPGAGIIRELLVYLDAHHEASAFQTRNIRSLSSIFVNVGIVTNVPVSQRKETGSETNDARKIPKNLYDLIRGILGTMPEGSLSNPLITCEIPINQRQSRELKLQTITPDEFISDVQRYIQLAPPENIEIQCNALRAAILARDALQQASILFHPTKSGSKKYRLSPLRIEQVLPETLLNLGEHLAILGDAGAGKTCIARTLAQKAMGQGIKCVYFPCNRISTTNRMTSKAPTEPERDDTLKDAIFDFLKYLAPNESHDAISKYIDTAQLIILDGCDEAPSFLSTLADDIFNLVETDTLHITIGRKNERSEIAIPLDLADRITFNRTTRKLTIEPGLRRLDIDRLLSANPDEKKLHVAIHKARSATKDSTPQIIITSRTSEPLHLSKAFVQTRLHAFTDKQLRMFFQRWLANSGQSADVLMEFLERHPRMKEICRRPIIATILAGIHEAGCNLPHSKTDLYEHRFDLLLDRWDLARNVQKRNRISLRDKKVFLSAIAIRLHTNHQRSFSRNDAEQLWKDLLSDYYPSLSIDDLLFELRVANSVIEPDDEGEYNLGHLSFQEYLTALAIVTHQKQSLLIDNFHEPWWREVILFYAGICGDLTSFVDELQGRNLLREEDARLQELLHEARYTDRIVSDFIRDAADSTIDYGH